MHCPRCDQRAIPLIYRFTPGDYCPAKTALSFAEVMNIVICNSTQCENSNLRRSEPNIFCPRCKSWSVKNLDTGRQGHLFECANHCGVLIDFTC
jgi:hypothetical protein